MLSADDWALLSRLHEARADITVIAVLADLSTRSYVQAILGGAVVAVPRDALPETLRKVFEAVVSGESVLPVEVVRALAAPESTPEEPVDVLSAHEISWLRELAHGTTVAHLAHRMGYSERAMYRLLRVLYARLGARNRTDALMRAHQRGWL
jgi:DNA-binding NarL/FixJ family response regulator